MDGIQCCKSTGPTSKEEFVLLNQVSGCQLVFTGDDDFIGGVSSAY